MEMSTARRELQPAQVGGNLTYDLLPLICRGCFTEGWRPAVKGLTDACCGAIASIFRDARD
jgi:hypothetical protein